MAAGLDGLSQKDVDSILRGAMPAVPAPAGPEILPYNFLRPPRISRDRRATLEGIHNRFALARLVKSPGVALPPDEAVTPEAVAAHWAEIENLAGAKPHRNAISAVGASFEVE